MAAILVIRRNKEDMMNDTVKKKPARSKPAGGDLRHETTPDLDALIASIEHMSPEQVRAKLQEFNVDSKPTVDFLTSFIDDKVREWRSHHPEEAAVAATPRRSFALALRNAQTPDEQLGVLHHAFEHLGVAADALRSHCAVDPDAALPLAETVDELALEVADRPALHDAFVSAYAALITHTAAVHQPAFTRQLADMRARGDASGALAARVSEVMAG
jgi:hypothetical protein